VVEEPAINSLDDLHMPSRTHKASITRRCVASLISAASIAAVLAVTPIQAAEWRIEPLIRAAGDFDDNAVLTPRTDVDADISGYIIDASAKFAYSSELTDFFVTPTLRKRDYGDPLYDSNDEFLEFGFDRDTQSSNFGVRGSYSFESVRTGERSDADLDVEDPDEIPDDDSGRVFATRTARETLRLWPAWTYRMSDASSFSVRLNFTDTSYDDRIPGIYTDWSNARANLSYQRRWSPRNTAILTGFYRKYFPDLGDDGTGFGFNAGFQRNLNETTRLRALAGLEETEQGEGESDVNWVADVSLSRRLQTITLLVQYRRSISGGGSGTLNARDSINLNFTRELNERISAGLGVRAYQTTALENAVNFDERDYLQLRAQFTWNMTQTWSLEANYRYTFSDREVLGESANSNNVTIWLNYRPTPIIRSR
jgi:hypothetical protein